MGKLFFHGTILNNDRGAQNCQKNSSLAFLFGDTAMKRVGNALRPRSVGLGTDDDHKVIQIICFSMCTWEYDLGEYDLDSNKNNNNNLAFWKFQRYTIQ